MSSTGQDTVGARMCQANSIAPQSPPVRGLAAACGGEIPIEGIFSVGELASRMGVTAECLKRYLQETGIKCCIPFGGTTWINVAKFTAGLACVPFERKKARGGGPRRKKG